MSGMKPKILIVEDETAVVTLLRYNLEHQGFEVDAVRDDGVRHMEIAGRPGGRRHDGVHLPDQPPGIARVSTLCGGCEDQLHRRPKNVLEPQAREHFRVAPRMPDAKRLSARRLQQTEQAARGDRRKAVGQAGPERGDAGARGALLRYQLHDHRGYPGETLLEIRRHHVDVADVHKFAHARVRLPSSGWHACASATALVIRALRPS